MQSFVSFPACDPPVLPQILDVETEISFSNVNKTVCSATLTLDKDVSVFIPWRRNSIWHSSKRERTAVSFLTCPPGSLSVSVYVYLTFNRLFPVRLFWLPCLTTFLLTCFLLLHLYRLFCCKNLGLKPQSCSKNSRYLIKNPLKVTFV